MLALPKRLSAWIDRLAARWCNRRGIMHVPPGVDVTVNPESKPIQNLFLSGGSIRFERPHNNPRILGDYSLTPPLEIRKGPITMMRFDAPKSP